MKSSKDLKTPKRFRLGLSGSSFIHVMPCELVIDSIQAMQKGEVVIFDRRQNDMMAQFMRDMTGAMIAMEIDCMECYHTLSWDKDLIVDIVKESGIEVWSVHAPYGVSLNPSSPVKEHRENARKGFADAVDAAVKLGARVIVAHPGADAKYDEPREKQLEYSAEVLADAAAMTYDAHINLAIEPMPRIEIGNSLDEVFWIIDRINKPNVGINFDTNHQYPAAAIPDLIRRAGGLILSVHFSDQDDVERHWLPFEGKIDWEAVLTALTDIGYSGPLVYEAHVANVEDCDHVVSKVVENYERMIRLAPANESRI